MRSERGTKRLSIGADRQAVELPTGGTNQQNSPPRTSPPQSELRWRPCFLTRVCWVGCGRKAKPVAGAWTTGSGRGTGEMAGITRNPGTSASTGQQQLYCSLDPLGRRPELPTWSREQRRDDRLERGQVQGTDHLRAKFEVRCSWLAAKGEAEIRGRKFLLRTARSIWGWRGRVAGEETLAQVRPGLAGLGLEVFSQRTGTEPERVPQPHEQGS